MDWYSVLESTIQIIVIGFAGLGITWYYSKKQHDLNHDEFQRDLFIEFNQRYDVLNDELHAILNEQKEHEKLSLEKLTKKCPATIVHLNDYLNLCAEQYFWYKKGRIDKAVWNSWSIGMNWWFEELQPLQDLWKEEKGNGNYESYYLVNGKDFLDEDIDKRKK